jgi:nucleoside-diphosphate-sugar epimerase
VEKIVVTGSKGGTGVSIVRAFREAGYRVVGIDVKPPDFGEADYHRLDLEDGASLHDVCAGAAGIVHFGSFPTDSQTSWEIAYRNLMLGGYHVLQAAANLRTPRVVLASSPEIYGDYFKVPYLPIDEEAPQAPPGIYGASKQCLEMLARNYARWHGIAIAALRPQRIVYEGSYEWRFRRFTLDDAAAADALWAYVDARDVATACLAWFRSDLQGFEVFNVAGADVCVTTPTRSLLHEFYPHVTDVRGELPGTSSLVSCERIRRMLGWEPRHRWQAMATESEARKNAS